RIYLGAAEGWWVEKPRALLPPGGPHTSGEAHRSADVLRPEGASRAIGAPGEDADLHKVQLVEGCCAEIPQHRPRRRHRPRSAGRQKAVSPRPGSLRDRA